MDVGGLMLGFLDQARVVSASAALADDACVLDHAELCNQWLVVS